MTGTGRMFFIGMLVCLLGACASPKDVVYLQDVKINSRVKAALQYRTVIHVDDLLSIVVSCDDIETALPFNTPGWDRITREQVTINFTGIWWTRTGRSISRCWGRLKWKVYPGRNWLLN